VPPAPTDEENFIAALTRQSSRISEIRDLQKAYEEMSKAVESFTRYVPRDVVKDLLESGQLCAIGMTPTTCAMLFADIESFTSICERVPPERFGPVVTAFFERMSSLVISHEGIVDKFIGDCVMAVWGAPFACAHKEGRAALCALRMSRECHTNPLRDAFDGVGERLVVRVGVHAGDVLAGNMGSSQRMSYTIIGDAVNLAARLEGMNKQFGTRVLTTDAVISLYPTAFVARLVGAVQAVGRATATRVFELLGLASDPTVDSAAAKSTATMPTVSPTPSSARAATRRQNSGGRNRRTTNGGSSATPTNSLQHGHPPPPSSDSEMDESLVGCSRRSAARIPFATALRFAAALSDAPLVCTEAEMQFADEYTTACDLYCNGDPEGCLAALRALQQAMPFMLPPLEPASARALGGLGANNRRSFNRSVLVVDDLTAVGGLSTSHTSLASHTHVALHRQGGISLDLSFTPADTLVVLEENALSGSAVLPLGPDAMAPTNNAAAAGAAITEALNAAALEQALGPARLPLWVTPAVSAERLVEACQAAMLEAALERRREEVMGKMGNGAASFDHPTSKVGVMRLTEK
jgi:class 3 adenylate cyclase